MAPMASMACSMGPGRPYGLYGLLCGAWQALLALLGQYCSMGPGRPYWAITAL